MQTPDELANAFLASPAIPDVNPSLLQPSNQEKERVQLLLEQRDYYTKLCENHVLLSGNGRSATYYQDKCEEVKIKINALNDKYNQQMQKKLFFDHKLQEYAASKEKALEIIEKQWKQKMADLTEQHNATMCRIKASYESENIQNEITLKQMSSKCFALKEELANLRSILATQHKEVPHVDYYKNIVRQRIVTINELQKELKDLEDSDGNSENESEANIDIINMSVRNVVVPTESGHQDNETPTSSSCDLPTNVTSESQAFHNMSTLIANTSSETLANVSRVRLQSSEMSGCGMQSNVHDIQILRTCQYVPNSLGNIPSRSRISNEDWDEDDFDKYSNLYLHRFNPRATKSDQVSSTTDYIHDHPSTSSNDDNRPKSPTTTKNLDKPEQKTVKTAKKRAPKRKLLSESDLNSTQTDKSLSDSN